MRTSWWNAPELLGIYKTLSVDERRKFLDSLWDWEHDQPDENSMIYDFWDALYDQPFRPLPR